MGNRKISVTTFLIVTFSVMLVITVMVSVIEIRGIHRAETTVASVRTEKMSGLMAKQNALSEIEDFLRIVKICYISKEENQCDLESVDLSEVTAGALKDEPDIRTIISYVNRIINSRISIENIMIHIDLLWDEYVSEVEAIASDMAGNINISMVARLISTNLQNGHPDKKTQHTIMNELRELFIHMPPAKRAHLEALADKTESTYGEYVAKLSEKRAKEAIVFNTWANADLVLQHMRNKANVETKLSIDDDISAIQNIIFVIQKTNFISLSAMWLSLLIYIFLVNRLINNPLRWASRQLNDIRKGKMEVKIPDNIYIKEIADISEMFDKMSEYLVKLYAHANQLEEDAAAKKDLEEVMRAVFKASLDGYFVWNNEYIEFVSPGTLEMLGLEKQDDFKDNWHSYGLSRKQFHVLYDMLTERGVVREEFNLASSDGEMISFEATHLVVYYHNTTSILTYLRDLRLQKAHEEALKKAKEQAEMATKAKSDFLARMSHEIRTPMNGVLGLTHLVLNSDLSLNQKELLTKIESSAQLLLRIINDILDFSKIESGSLKLEHTPFVFNSVLGTVCDLMKPLAEEKKLLFSTAYSGDTSLTVLGDPLRLSQVMLNLASNAVKFTDAGSVDIVIDVLKDYGRQILVHFSVTDTGIGLTGEQLANLFQPFSQADISTTRKYGGTGLGLMISKLIVEMMGGQIEIESKYGSGSTFSFILKFTKYCEDIVSEEHEEFIDESVLPGKRVLVAEDNAVNQLVIKSVLENFGMHVVIANNGREAIIILDEADFDCVMMDIQMPVMDGLEATRYIREQGRDNIKNIPIIAMTAHAMQTDIEKSIAAGMDAHLTKPIDLTDMKNCLIKYLK